VESWRIIQDRDDLQFEGADSLQGRQSERLPDKEIDKDKGSTDAMSLMIDNGLF